ncbi:hypothetical protein DL93DRAFT_2057014, partial [Clavulina sp. PMI_390]
LLYITIAGCITLLTSVIGGVGAILNSRPILALYNALLWPSFLATAAVGYSGYKRRTFDLSGKIDQAWTQFYGDQGRLVVQDTLKCCGLYNPLHQATLSPRCFSRSALPGCKRALIGFETHQLDLAALLAFMAVGLILVSIIVAVLCSNHVNQLFGKGLMPRHYRLRSAQNPLKELIPQPLLI